MENENLHRAAAYLVAGSLLMSYALVRDLAAEGIPVRLTCGVLGCATQADSPSDTGPGPDSRTVRGLGGHGAFPRGAAHLLTMRNHTACGSTTDVSVSTRDFFVAGAPA